MLWKVTSFFLLSILCDSQGRKSKSSCKDPDVAKRLLSDDVRIASPFYVLALPRNYETEQIDNVCYTYFETGSDKFFHIISVTFKDGNNKYYRYTKGDIPGRKGVAEAKALDSSPCTYHDFTLTPILCNNTVFPLYRCFLKGGSCKNIDAGKSKGVDVRLALAASPRVQEECLAEIEKSFKDTSFFDGGDYIILPRVLSPLCVTKYNDVYSVGHLRAVGSREVIGPDPQAILEDEVSFSDHFYFV